MVINLLKKFLLIPDLILSIISLMIFLVIFLSSRLFKKEKRHLSNERKMLIIATTHSYGSIKRHGHESMVLSRDLKGFFSKVITVYPLLGSNPYDDAADFDTLIFKRTMNDVHDFYECKIYLSEKLKMLRMLNFALSQFSLMFFMRRLIINENISVVRGSDPFFTGLFASLLSFVCQIPYAMRIGGDYDALYKNGIVTFKKIFYSYKIEKFIGKFVFKYCDLILAANENYKRYSIENNARPDKVDVIRYGNIIEPYHFDSPNGRGNVNDLPWAENKFFIVVGRLSALKHPEDVLYAFKEIYQQNKDIGIVFVGQGDTEEDVKKLAEELKISENCIFVGNKNQEWLHKVYPKALAYLSPLTGRALVEAALAELPLIAYDFEWHSEIVIHEKTGLLVEYRNTKKLSDAMLRVISDPKLSLDLGTNARKFVYEMMHFDIVREKEKDAYRKIIN